jgi:hypoxanthine phosphoribosyltransferase
MKDFISWDLIDECVTDITYYLHQTNIKYEGVYGIPRGGVILAVILSHKLDIPYLVNLDNMHGKKFIIIDDITDTGKTLNKYKKLDVCENACYVTIHEHEHSIVKPEYAVINKEDKWIVYPWEAEDSEEIQDYITIKNLVIANSAK